MALTFAEVPESRDQSYGSSDSITLKYKASGEPNDATVRNYAYSTGSPATVTGLTGTLYRKSISLRPDGFAQYWVDVEYGRLEKNSLPRGSYTFNFDTSGGTTHITCAKEHIHTYPTNADAHKGVIGVKQDGSVEGADVVIPKLKFTLAFKYPSGIITVAWVKTIASITGTTNSDRFLGYDAGELLFLGARGSNGTESEMEVSFDFEASQNATGLTSAGVTGIAKKGHEYAWQEFGDEVDSGKGYTRAKSVHVERVYDSVAFASYFTWNIFTG